MFILIIIPLLWIFLLIEFQQINKKLHKVTKIFFLILIIILTPISLMILFHTLCYFIQLPIYAFTYIDIVYLPLLITIILLILGIKFLKSYNQLNFFNTIILIFILSIITIPLAQYSATQYIYKIAQKSHHKQPEYVDIEFDCEIRRPHSILLDNNKEYYWSFHKRSFIQGKNLRSWL